MLVRSGVVEDVLRADESGCSRVKMNSIQDVPQDPRLNGLHVPRRRMNGSWMPCLLGDVEMPIVLVVPYGQLEEQTWRQSDFLRERV